MKNNIIYKDKLQDLEDKLFELEEKWNECKRDNLDFSLPTQIYEVRQEINNILNKKN